MRALTLIFFLLPLSGFAGGPPHDTLWVSHDKTFYIVFGSEVEIVNIGNEDFDYSAQKNIVLLSAIKQKAVTTSLMVTLKTGDVYVWYLGYRHHPPRLMEDMRAGTHRTTGGPTASNGAYPVKPVANRNSEITFPRPSGSGTGSSAASYEAYQQRQAERYADVQPPGYIAQREQSENRDFEAPDGIIQNKMFYVLKQGRDVNDIGEIDNSIYFMLHNIYVDRKYIYLKIAIHNTSSIAFDIDLISFERQQKGGMKRREGSSNHQLDVMYKESVRTVGPSQLEYMVYAVSLFAFEEKDALVVKLSEMGGVRTMKFNVPAKLITNSKSL